MGVLQELRKNNESSNIKSTFFSEVTEERTFDHLIFGDSIWSLMLADTLSKLSSSEKTNAINATTSTIAPSTSSTSPAINFINTKGNFETFPISSGINLLRGETNLKIFQYILNSYINNQGISDYLLNINVPENTVKYNSKFYKEHEFRSFNNRMRPTGKITDCEVFFTFDHYSISLKSLLANYFSNVDSHSKTHMHFLNDNNNNNNNDNDNDNNNTRSNESNEHNKSNGSSENSGNSRNFGINTTAKIKSIYSRHLLANEYYWPIEMSDGSILLTKKIFWDLGVNEFFKVLKNKNLHSDIFHQFCNDSKRQHSLVMSFQSEKNITNEKNTFFIPRSLADDSGYFIGEFAPYNEQTHTQDFIFFAFLDNDEVIEDVSKIIRNLKRCLKKTFPSIEKTIIRENIEIGTNLTGNPIDDLMFGEVKDEIPNIFFIGTDAPIDLTIINDLQKNIGSFNHRDICYLTRGLLSHISCIKNIKKNS
ncbi:MAG: hypothetical protein HQK51_14130 [Oligoflexia bacterium]|nr:hypothetical protein [Oligoflexia bacterium]